MPESPPATFGIEAISVTKRFGGFVALDQVSLRVAPGSFHALLGENGAGKSTLVKCIMGYYRADAGEIILGDRQQVIDSPRTAHALGLGMVYQHFTLVPSMTVAENFILGKTQLPAVLRWRDELTRLDEFFAAMPFRVPLDVPAGALAAGEKQKAEITKQLYLGRRFLILDEPTSVLTPDEADEILGLLKQMTRDGRLTVLMITHKLREVMAFADEVSVLRRGRYVGGGRVGEIGPSDCAELMLGSAEIRRLADRSGAPGAPTLEIAGLSADDDRGHPACRDIDIAVRGGEIVGIAGVSGNGQRELVEALDGQRPPTGGTILVHGKPYHARRNEMREARFNCLPEEPLRNACVASMSVAENLVMRDFDRPPFAFGGWWLRPRSFRAAAAQLVERYRVKTASLDAPIGTLSGGNVQRCVLARELGGEGVAVLVAANPCFGLDMAAVAEIHAQLMEARNRGAAILLVSEDLDELLELSDRILVMFNGRLVHETATAATDRTAIGRHMAGN
jgi:general nucleoside transport system ATP-binding protein